MKFEWLIDKQQSVSVARLHVCWSMSCEPLFTQTPLKENSPVPRDDMYAKEGIIRVCRLTLSYKRIMKVP